MNYWKLKLMKNSIFIKILFIFLVSINIDVFAKGIIIEGNQLHDIVHNSFLNDDKTCQKLKFHLHL